jgi:hypothetical protein
MKEIKTASYLKLSQEVFTPLMENEYADKQSRLSRRERDLGLSFKRKNRKGLTKRQLQDGLGEVDKDMDANQWKDWVRGNLGNKSNEESDRSRRLLERLREPAFAKSKKIVIEAKNKK